MRKIGLFLFFLLIMGAIALYFYTNESYKKSIEAKYFYMKEDYKKAYLLSREAFGDDPYNKMAFSVMTQSKIAFKFQDYINDGKKYLLDIKSISEKKSISKADKVRIKMMCETMMQKYQNISPTVLTNKKLFKEATKIYKQFKQIYEDLF